MKEKETALSYSFETPSRAVETFIWANVIITMERFCFRGGLFGAPPLRRLSSACACAAVGVCVCMCALARSAASDSRGAATAQKSPRGALPPKQPVTSSSRDTDTGHLSESEVKWEMKKKKKKASALSGRCRDCYACMCVCEGEFAESQSGGCQNGEGRREASGWEGS